MSQKIVLILTNKKEQIKHYTELIRSMGASYIPIVERDLVDGLKMVGSSLHYEVDMIVFDLECAWYGLGSSEFQNFKLIGNFIPIIEMSTFRDEYIKELLTKTDKNDAKKEN